MERITWLTAQAKLLSLHHDKEPLIVERLLLVLFDEIQKHINNRPEDATALFDYFESEGGGLGLCIEVEPNSIDFDHGLSTYNDIWVSIDLDINGEPPLPEYEKETYRRFVDDMRRAGFDPYHYRGRNFWEGPAINVDYLEDAHRATTVACQHDNMGMGYVVYPNS